MTESESTRDIVVRRINRVDATVSERITDCLDYLVEDDEDDKSRRLQLKDDHELVFHLGISLLEAAVEPIADKEKLLETVSGKLDKCFDKKSGITFDNYKVDLSSNTASATGKTLVDVNFMAQSSWVLNLLTKVQGYSYLVREALNKKNIFYVQHGAAEKPDTKIGCLEQITDEPNALVWLTLLYFNKGDWNNTLKYAQRCFSNTKLMEKEGIKSYLLLPLVKSVYELGIGKGNYKSMVELFGDNQEAYTSIELLCGDDFFKIANFYHDVLHEREIQKIKAGRKGQEPNFLEKELQRRKGEAYRQLARKNASPEPTHFGFWYERILNDSPDDAEANLMLARLDTEQNKLVDAEAKYQKVLNQKDCPVEFKVEANLFMARSGSGADTLTTKKKHYLTVLGLQPDNIEARLFMGGLNLRESVSSYDIDTTKLNEAREYYISVLKKDATNLTALRGLGRCYFYNKQWEQAFNCFEKCFDNIPNDDKIEPTGEHRSFFLQGDFAAMLFSQYKHFSGYDSFPNAVLDAEMMCKSTKATFVQSSQPILQDESAILFQTTITTVAGLYGARANKINLNSSRKRKSYFGFDPLAMVGSDNQMDVYNLIQEEIMIISKYGYDYNPANKPPLLARMYLTLGGKRRNKNG